ncbi:uncharacterized protein EDB91DRAFT_1237791 [Suillus paluster]|uniref:uncharacterized protein n=1 Tax=Suillus paluster TaxID=48578 RepID=UPI001B884AF8|nr:uncharacterized protein EDB91DRAFT_1237791 [Suillus paluster]KAG1738088.1 hypothetical protein EDB91DRAFT_1237791 [Suillus paluster]
MPDTIPCTQIWRRDFNALQLPFGHAGCKQFFKMGAGCTKHILSAHPVISSPPPEQDIDIDVPDVLLQELENQYNGCPCDAHGHFLNDNVLPPSHEPQSPNDWTPFHNCTKFKTADLFYTQNPTPAWKIDTHLALWASTLLKHDHRDLYATIDTIPLGEVKWESEKPEGTYPPWMDSAFDVWYQDPHQVGCNMLANPDFTHETDFRPYQESTAMEDFMSADWAWDQADTISEDPDTMGATFIPVILRSDKMTVSVGTGNNEYYPLYLSIGNIHNNVLAVLHRNAVAVIGFLAMPKSELRPRMMKPEVAKFGDGHFQRIIYGLGPYIADYKEQVLLVCIVRCWCPRCMAPNHDLDAAGTLPQCQEYTEELVDMGTYLEPWDEFGVVADLVPFTNDFPRADICQLIAPNILHQLIKGIDNSKALMKVYIAAIEGHVPVDIVCTFCAFLKFCYIVRNNAITEHMLEKLQDAVCHFHHYRKIFLESDTISTFSHYLQLIRLFGAPNGLCSSITESKHIKAVKGPWRRSSKYQALSQMLVTNQWLNKLTATQVDFTSRGMLNGTCLSAALEALYENLNVSVPEDDIDGVDHGPTILQMKRARTVLALAEELNIPHLPEMVYCFLFQQTCPDDPQDASEIPIAGCPQYEGKISVFNSACSRFYAPSNLSGIGGMRIEHIRACPMWRNEAPCYDCVFVNIGSEDVGIRGLEVARICIFFSFNYGGITYLCAVVCWFDIIGDSPDEDTGMWMVRPACGTNNAPIYNIIHVNSIYRVAHLIPVYGRRFLHHGINLHNSYDSFHTIYVNQYADHHAFELAS